MATATEPATIATETDPPGETRRGMMFAFEGFDEDLAHVVTRVVASLGDEMSHGGYIGPLPVGAADLALLWAMWARYEPDAGSGDALAEAAYAAARFVLTEGALRSLGHQSIRRGEHLKSITIHGYASRIDQLALAADAGGCVIQEQVDLRGDAGAEASFVAALVSGARPKEGQPAA
jgi:hypothetical protein